MYLPAHVATRAATGAVPDGLPTRRSYAELRSAPSVSGVAESQAEGSDLGTEQVCGCGSSGMLYCPGGSSPLQASAPDGELVKAEGCAHGLMSL